MCGPSRVDSIIKSSQVRGDDKEDSIKNSKEL